MGQFQAFIRDVFDMVQRGFNMGEAQQLATARLGARPVREGLDMMAQMQHYDNLRGVARDRLTDQAVIPPVQSLTAQIQPSEPGPPSYHQVTRGLLQQPPPR